MICHMNSRKYITNSTAPTTKINVAIPTQNSTIEPIRSPTPLDILPKYRCPMPLSPKRPSMIASMRAVPSLLYRRVCGVPLRLGEGGVLNVVFVCPHWGHEADLSVSELPQFEQKPPDSFCFMGVPQELQEDLPSGINELQLGQVVSTTLRQSLHTIKTMRSKKCNWLG